MNRKRMIVLLTIVWMIFIFHRSIQPASQSRVESLRVLEWLYRVLPFRPSHNFIRKLAHFTEYAVLGGLAAALFRTVHGSRPVYQAYRLCIPLGALTALLDETIQLFVPGRSGEIRDMWIDIGGCAAGGLAVVLIFTLARFFTGRVKKLK